MTQYCIISLEIDKRRRYTMNILEKLTNQMQGTIESGVSLALHNKNQEVEPVHLLWALLTNSGSILHQALNKMNVDKAAIELETKSIANKLPLSLIHI